MNDSSRRNARHIARPHAPADIGVEVGPTAPDEPAGRKAFRFDGWSLEPLDLEPRKISA